MLNHKSTSHVCFISMATRYDLGTCEITIIIFIFQSGVKVIEKPLNKHYLDSSDVFILDMGLKLYQWNGKTGNKDEKYKAAEYLKSIVV